MTRSIFYRICVLLVLLSAGYLPLQQVRAQETSSGSLYNLRTAAFPTIKFSMDAFDPSGNFVSALDRTNITILEDGQKHTPDDLLAFDPGVEFVVAINPGRSLGILDGQGLSRYDKIARVLSNWAGALPAKSADAYSLVTSGGPSAFHTRDPRSWLTSLEAYQPLFKDLAPSFDLLSQAIDLASTSMLEPGARRAILFITPLAQTTDVTTLQSLAVRASQLDVHVFVWLVAGADSPATPGFLALQDLAAQSKAQFFIYSGSETLPNPSDYLAPFRSAYELTYTSSLSTSGNHTLAVSVSAPTGQIDLPPVEFEMDVRSPNPILVTPPNEILRQPVDPNHYDLTRLLPADQALELIIEFPDGHPRSLVSTSLLVDGKTVATNASEPFDRFTWDLQGYTISGKHDLQVEVVDVLGLQKTSISIPVTITIAAPAPAWKIFIARYGTQVSLGVLIGASLLLIWRLVRLLRIRRLRRKNRLSPSGDLVETSSSRSLFHRGEKKAPACLFPLPEDGSNPVSGTLQLVAKEIRLGSDASKADYLLKHPSVEGLHAIVYRHEDRFFIADQDSLSGTWVNYRRLPAGQCLLNHADIIHFGMLSYRFQLNEPPAQPGSTIRVRPDSPSV